MRLSALTRIPTGRTDYRADLDGLRAISVVAVLLFHLDLEWFSGGFIGVDIFFVLSGYFITRQIYAGLTDGQFSLVNFYDRRIRRIVPALTVMIFAVAIAGWFVLLPGDYERLGYTLIGAALSFSNFQFWGMSGYFAPTADSLPLLHTWSLAVEEQFYLIMPLLLCAVWSKLRRWLPIVLWLMLTGSFVLSIGVTAVRPSAAFYLLPTRAWELMLGSALAVGLVQVPSANWQREVAALAGIGGVVFSVFAITDQMPFPGPTAALPCISAAAIIWSGLGQSATCSTNTFPIGARLLGFPPMVFIGLISYSLYLWHWPIIVIANLSIEGEIQGKVKFMLAGLCFTLAIASWRLIEMPMRQGGMPWPRVGQRLVSAAISLSGVAVLGTTIQLSHGLPTRLPETVAALDSGRLDYSPARLRCHLFPSDAVVYQDTCLFGDASEPKIVVLGDSHGVEIAWALQQQARRHGSSVRQITASGCPPAIGFKPAISGPHCRAYNLRMLAALGTVSPTRVIVVARYFFWNTRPGFWPALNATVTSLRKQGHKVVLLGAVPGFPNGENAPRTLSSRAWAGEDVSNYRFALDRDTAFQIRRHLENLAGQDGVEYISAIDELCNLDDKCRSILNGRPLYFDSNHLSLSGARLIVEKRLSPALWPSPASSNQKTPHHFDREQVR